MITYLTRWLPWRRHREAPTATLPSPEPDLRMPEFTHHRADFLSIRRMHLLRADECFEYSLIAWIAAVRFAHITGGWQPAGTTAIRSFSPPDYGGQGMLASGHYLPAGQAMSAEDACALAAGLRQALREMPRGTELRDGGGLRAHQVRDPRLHERETLAGAEVVIWQFVVDTDMDDGDGERLAAFLERGACTIEFGEPTHVRKAAEAARRRRERRLPFEREQERLLSALQSGAIDDSLAGPRLAAIRERLDAFDAEEAERTSATA